MEYRSLYGKVCIHCYVEISYKEIGLGLINVNDILNIDRNNDLINQIEVCLRST